MPEATQDFAPVSSQSGAPSVGSVPALIQDSTFDKINAYASKMNVSNIREARAEQYIEGQMQAAQADGVEEVRKQTPWVAKLFGGGAALSGAMDYMEKTRVLEYKQAVADDMDNLRTLRPEDFQASQMEDVKKFLTDDDETNERIMQSFNTILPDVVRAQAKAHAGYVQEQHLDSMTTFTNLALEATMKAKATGDEADIERAMTYLHDNLDRPAGMNKDAYKNFLYDTLAHASSIGDSQVAYKIQELGLIDTPADIDKLDKAQVALAKYNKQQQVFQFGESLSNMRQMADNPEIDHESFYTQLQQQTVEFGYSPEQVASLFNRRLTSLQKQSSAVDYEHNVELARTGNGNQIPTAQRQPTFAVMDEGVQQGKIPVQEYIESLSTLGTKSKATSERWRAGLQGSIIEVGEGQTELSPTAQATLNQMDQFYILDEEVALNQMDDTTAAVYMAYRARRDIMGASSPATHMQRALDDVAFAKEAPRASMSAEQKEDALDSFVDNSPFKEQHFDNQAFAADYKAIQNMFGADPGAAAQTSRVKALLSQWEIRGKEVIPKVDNKSISEWVGVPDPIGVAEAMVAANMVPGTEGRDVSIKVRHREGKLVFWDNDAGLPLTSMPFETVVDHATQGFDQAVTSVQEAAYTELLNDAKHALVTKYAMQNPVMPDDDDIDGIPFTSEAVDTIAGMSDEQIIAEYSSLQEEVSPMRSMLQDVGKKLYESSLGGESAGGLTPIGTSIAKMFGYHADERVKTKNRAARAQAGTGASMISYGKRTESKALQARIGLPEDQQDGIFGPVTLARMQSELGLSKAEAFKKANETLNADRVLHAVGKYQVIGKTLMETYLKAGLSLDTVFNEEAQEKLFVNGLLRKQPAVDSFLNGTGTLQAAGDQIKNEWIGLNKSNESELFRSLEQAKAGDTTALSDLIMRYESQGRGFNAYTRGGVTGDSGIFTDTLDENITGKTIKQILIQQGMM